VRQGIGLPSVWEDLIGQVYLGDEKFVGKMTSMAEQSPLSSRPGRSRLELPNAQCRPAPLPLATYAEQHPNDRNAAMRAAFGSGSYTMAQLAQHFKLHHTSVSRIVKMA
jgi:putative transposase